MRQFCFIFRIVEAVEKHLPNKLEINALASTLNVSRWHLQHEFKRYTGIPLGRYYRLRLLTLAIDKIATSDQRIIDIALDFGFESQEALYRAIRSNFAISPKHFRCDPTLAKYVGLSPLDRRYLELYQVMLANPPAEEVFPARQFVGVAGNFRSIFFEETKMMQGIEQLWQRFNQATHLWDHSTRNHYVLEYRNNCSYRSGEFQMMAVCDGQEESSQHTLARVDLSQRKMWHFTLPNSGSIYAMFIYLNQVFSFQNKLSLSRLPYIWAMNHDGSMEVWVEFKPKVSIDHLPDSIVSLVPHTLSSATKASSIKSYTLPSHLVLKSQRLAHLLELFSDRLDEVNKGNEGLLIGGDVDEAYSPLRDYQVHHFASQTTGKQVLGQGEYLKCHLAGHLAQIGEDLDSLYYAYLSESKYYLRQGYEWITRAEKTPEQEWNIELLIPVSKR